MGLQAQICTYNASFVNIPLSQTGKLQSVRRSPMLCLQQLNATICRFAMSNTNIAMSNTNSNIAMQNTNTKIAMSNTNTKWQITKCVSTTVECGYLSLCYVARIAQHTWEEALVCPPCVPLNLLTT